MAPERYTLREDIINKAKGYVTRERNKSYGEPDEDFQRIAAIASAMGFRVLKNVPREDGDTSEFQPLDGSDVAKFMICLKLSRLAWMPTHEDSWADIVGYAACGFETATLEQARRAPEQPKVAPVETMVVQRSLSHPIVEAANFAVQGKPSHLEGLGLFLQELPNFKHCGLLCSEQAHAFHTSCRYRVHGRRQS